MMGMYGNESRCGDSRNIGSAPVTLTDEQVRWGRSEKAGACIEAPPQKITVAMAISQMGETVLDMEGAIARIDQSLLQPRPEKNGCDVGIGNREPTLPESICILEKRIRDAYERLDRLGMIVAEQLGGYKLE